MIWESSQNILEYAATIPEVVGTERQIKNGGRYLKQTEFTPEIRCPKSCLSVEWLSHWCRTLYNKALRSETSDHNTLEREVDLRLHLLSWTILARKHKERRAEVKIYQQERRNAA